jgi:hypothetical protein
VARWRDAAEAIAVRRSPLDDPRGKFVYVLDRDKIADVAGVRPVTLGMGVRREDAKANRIVERGLKPGERVIVDGATPAPGALSPPMRRRPAGPAGGGAANDKDVPRRQIVVPGTAMFSAFHRPPIFAAVISLFLVLAACRDADLPVRVPEIAPPVVTVRPLPGAPRRLERRSPRRSRTRSTASRGCYWRHSTSPGSRDR